LAACFSTDSCFIFSSGLDGSISVYDLGTGEELKRFSAGRCFGGLIGNPRNTQLACYSEDNAAVEIRDVASGRMLRTLNCPWGVSSVAWSPDGRRLATACLDRRIYLWDGLTGQLQATLEGHFWTLVNVVFDHTGELLASSSFDQVVRLWDVPTGREVANHPGFSWQLQFSPDNRQLSGWSDLSRHGALEVAYGQECRLLFVEPSERSGRYYSGPDFSPDGHFLAAGSGNQVRFWDGFSGKELGSFPLRGCDAQLFHPDGRSLIVTDRSGGASRRALERVGDPDSRAYRLGKPTPIFLSPDVRGAALSQDGRYLALALESEGGAVVVDLQDPSAKPVPLHPHPLADRIDISPDGRWVATASWHNALVKVWDARSGDLVRTLQMPGRTEVTFSPDGHWLATSTSEFQLWEVGSWLPKGPAVPAHPIFNWNLAAFSPDSRLMARTFDGKTIQLMETLTAKPFATLEAPGGVGIWRFRFSPDGSRLAVVQADQQVRLWDLRLIRHELAQMNLDWDLPPYPPIVREASLPAKLEIEPVPARQTSVP
jgi:WD40 repeat protein